MAKIHRMTATEHRAWRANTPQLVAENGEIVRALTSIEEETCGICEARAKSRGQTIDTKIFVPDPAAGQAREVSIQVVATTTDRGDVVTQTTVDGLRRVTARDVIKARLLAEHKCDVQLRLSNGIVVGMVRTGEARPTAEDANRTVPRAEFCPCKNWGHPHPGQHHPACEHNQYAVPGERSGASLTDQALAESPENAGDAARAAAAAPPPALFSVAGPANSPAPTAAAESSTLYSPEDCPRCKDWAKPAGSPADQHHTLCAYRAEWEKSRVVTAGATYFLVDIGSGETLREATADELAAAIRKEQETGAPTIEVAGRVYMVMNPNEDTAAVDSTADAAAEAAEAADELATELLSDEAAPETDRPPPAPDTLLPESADETTVEGGG